MIRRPAPVLALAVACAACNPSLKPCTSEKCAATHQAFCDALSANFCHRLVECGFVDPDHAGDCLRFASTRSCDASRPSVERQLQRYRPDIGQKCLADILATSCFDPLASFSLPPCADVLEPASQTNDPCYLRADCAVPGDSCQGIGCGHTCRPTFSNFGAGTPCASTTDCLSGLACDAVLGTCQVRTRGALGAVCTGDVLTCGPAWRCQGGPPGTCVEVGLGDACDGSAQCPSGSGCSDAGTCQPATEGSDCRTSRNCGPDAACATGCAPGGDGGCTWIGRCTAAVPAGELCGGRPFCAAPNICRAAEDGLRCQPFAGEGDSCPQGEDSPAICAFPYECQSGRCAVAGHSGQVCWAGSVCFDGACGDLDFRCGPYLADGETCFRSTDCASSVCLNQSCTRCP